MTKFSRDFTLPDSYVYFKKHEVFNRLTDKFDKQDSARLWSLILNCKQILEEEIEGDFAEVGVHKGNSAVVLAEIANKAGRDLYLFDTFNGFDKKDLEGVDDKFQEGEWGGVSIDDTKAFIGEAVSCCHFEAGYFPETFTEKHKEKKYSIVSIDCDLYKPIKSTLDEFYPLMSHGGVFLIHDYSSGFWKGATDAVNEFCKETGEFLILMPDKSGSAFIRKSKKVKI